MILVQLPWDGQSATFASRLGVDRWRGVRLNDWGKSDGEYRLRRTVDHRMEQRRFSRAELL